MFIIHEKHDNVEFLFKTYVLEKPPWILKLYQYWDGLSISCYRQNIEKCNRKSNSELIEHSLHLDFDVFLIPSNNIYFNYPLLFCSF